MEAALPCAEFGTSLFWTHSHSGSSSHNYATVSVTEHISVIEAPRPHATAVVVVTEKLELLLLSGRHAEM